MVELTKETLVEYDDSYFDLMAKFVYGSNKRNKQQEITPLLTGIEADIYLSEQIPFIIKILFLATNLPYWILSVFALYDFVELTYFQEDADLISIHTVCGHPLFYFLIGFTVALSSTLMHGSQLRLGNCLCFCMHDHSKRINTCSDKFHEPKAQKLLKRVDITCAISALLCCVSCRAWQDIIGVFAIALPLFFSGIFLKRMSYHYLYLISHGLWHVATAALAWDAIMSKHR
jgi:hypothetical protein